MKGHTEAVPDLTSPGTLSKNQTFGLHRSTESQGGRVLGEQLAGAADSGDPQA